MEMSYIFLALFHLHLSFSYGETLKCTEITNDSEAPDLNTSLQQGKYPGRHIAQTIRALASHGVHFSFVDPHLPTDSPFMPTVSPIVETAIN